MGSPVNGSPTTYPFHLWGAKAIADRLGYRNVKSFLRAWAEGRVFAYKRKVPHAPWRPIWYSNADLIARSELLQVKRQLEDYRAKVNPR